MAVQNLLKIFVSTFNGTTQCLRYSSSMIPIKASKLLYSEYGDPCKVVQLQDDQLGELNNGEVLVKMLAAPVNPADINTIEGKYPSRPQLPAVPGNEGVGEVVSTASDITDLKVGDRVVPLTNMLGTWRTHMVLARNQLLQVPRSLGLVEAATITVNPCTAYRLLRDFASLRPGDVVIQNGANSACGQNVIQLARVWGYRTVNIVRDRPNVDELRSFLKNLGADVVLTEEELRKTDIFKSKQLPKPKLGLNCIGGKNALEVMRHLDHSAPIVTYGGMSREPLTVATSALIFKNLEVRGFWMTEWNKRYRDSPKKQEMMDEIVSLMSAGKLQGPKAKIVPFQDFKDALANALTMQGMIGQKFILQF